MERLSWIVIVVLLFASACEEPSEQLPPTPEGYRLELGDMVLCSDPAPPGESLPYHEVSTEAGLAYAPATPIWEQMQNGYNSLDVEFNGGIAVTDLDGDSALDLVLIDHDSPPRIFYGNGAGDFTESAATAVGIEAGGAYLIGISAADIDGDDRAELLLLGSGPNLLFANEGDGTFADRSAELGLSGPDRRSLSAAWADPDQDGDLDVLIVNHGRGSMGPEDQYPPQADQLFIQDAGTFTDRIELLYPDPAWDGYGFAAGWFDADADGLLDLYVVNDLATDGEDRPPNFFAHNTTEPGAAAPSFSKPEGSHLEQPMMAMGLALGDMDHDGDLDVHVSNAGRTFLASNEGGLSFVDTSLSLAGLSASPRGDISWSTEFFDYDNDGRLELFCSFGHMPSKAERSFNETDNSVAQYDALWARSGDGSFEDIAEDLGIDSPLSTRTVVAADFDGNGFLDLVTWALYEGPRLYRAGCNDNSWLIVELDLPGTLNRDAIGARIEAWAEGELIAIREMTAGSTGSLSSGPAQVHLGLGHHELVELRIRWPRGEESVHPQMPTQRKIRIIKVAPP